MFDPSLSIVRRRARPLLALFLFCLTLHLGGCGTSETPADGDGDAAVAADAGDDSAVDAAKDLSSSGEFQIGTHTAYEGTPEGFEPITEGTEVPLTFGVQGSWMVVLAFRTRDMLQGKLDLVAEISIGGVESGDISLEAQETFPGGDGWDYYYNLFLAIDGDQPQRGTPGHIAVRVTDETGTTAEQEHDIVIGPEDGT